MSVEDGRVGYGEAETTSREVMWTDGWSGSEKEKGKRGVERGECC